MSVSEIIGGTNIFIWVTCTDKRRKGENVNLTGFYKKSSVWCVRAWAGNNTPGGQHCNYCSKTLTAITATYTVPAAAIQWCWAGLQSKENEECNDQQIKMIMLQKTAVPWAFFPLMMHTKAQSQLRRNKEKPCRFKTEQSADVVNLF